MVTGRRGVTIIAGLAVLISGGGCNHQRAADPPDTAPATVDAVSAELPAELADPERPPDPELLLPPLPGYLTDDQAEPGELEASLDHGSIPYVDLRRRLILDEQGFTRAEVTVVTVQPDSEGIERFLRHHYGDVDRTPIRVGGVQMLRLAAEPFAVLAWSGPNFVVSFARGQEASDEWLENLAGATVEAIAAR